MRDHSGTRAKNAAPVKKSRNYVYLILALSRGREKFTETATSFQVIAIRLFVDKQLVANRHQQATRLAVQEGQLGETKVSSHE
jgi:hypothetical protein